MRGEVGGRARGASCSGACTCAPRCTQLGAGSPEACTRAAGPLGRIQLGWEGRWAGSGTWNSSPDSAANLLCDLELVVSPPPRPNIRICQLLNKGSG